MLGILVSFILFLPVAVIILQASWKKWTASLSSVPSPPTIPWLGTAPYLELDPFKLFKQIKDIGRKFNQFTIIWIGHKPIVSGGIIELAEPILSSKNAMRKSSFYNFLHGWLGTGLLTSSGTKWKARRKALTPSFHFEILKDFIKMFENHAQILTKKLSDIANENKEIDVQQIISLATLDIICETAMGIKVEAMLKDSVYARTIRFVNNQLFLRMRSPWLWPKFFYLLTPNGRKFFRCLDTLHSFTTNVINQRIKARKCNATSVNVEAANGKRKKVFLDILLDLYDQDEIDVAGIQEEVDTFMFEGHDTTAAGISWVLYLLARNQNAQKKLHFEIDAVSEELNSNVDKIINLKYLEYVIKESMRIHPPVTIIGRTLDKETTIKGLKLPKNTEILISPAGLHNNPNYWIEPEKFMPERFGDEGFSKRNPFVFVPFSAGPRNCIGQKFAMLEMKILLYHIMLDFSLTSSQHEDDVACTLDIIHKSNNGLMVRFTKRP